MVWFDRRDLKEKLKNLSEDIENCELKNPTWLWIIGGGLIGLASSCLKFKRNSGEPIIANLNKVSKNMEDIV